MKNLAFTNFILAVIACLLAWKVVYRPATTALAQDAAGRLTIQTIADPSVLSSDGLAGWDQELNTAVGTGDILAAVSLPNQHQIAIIVRRPR